MGGNINNSTEGSAVYIRAKVKVISIPSELEFMIQQICRSYSLPVINLTSRADPKVDVEGCMKKCTNRQNVGLL